MQLFINGITAYPNMAVETFRKEHATLVSWSEPSRQGSSGRVHLVFLDGSSGAYFPGVINGKFKE